MDALCFLDETYALGRLYILDGAFPLYEDCTLDDDYVLGEMCIVRGVGIFFDLGGYRNVGRV